MSKCNFMSWTILLKRALVGVCWDLGAVSLLVKLLNSILGSMLRREAKTQAQSESIQHMSLSCKMWSCNIQDWALKETKSYEEASAIEYKTKPPNLMGRETSRHYMSSKKGPPQNLMSSITLFNLLSKNNAASSM